jgi:CDP-diacylglycerol--serine O-phosphatidyltransferase
MRKKMMGPKIKVAYLLPNLFTAGSIFLGIMSVEASIKGDFLWAGWCILLSLICDGLDGRVARMTNTTSKFGVEFDSLADIVAFGVAPAVLYYCSVGDELGRYGLLVTALFVIFGAVRLARFNVQVGEVEPNVFIGVPIPTAAVFVTAQLMLLSTAHHVEACLLGVTVSMILASVLMVSNIRYPSFKKLDLSRSNFVKMLVLLIVLFSTLYLYPLEALVALSSGYVVYGLIRGAYYKFFGKKILLKK